MEDQNQTEYEVSYWLISPEAESAVAAVLTKHGAAINQTKPAAEMRLAYPIKRHATGLFGFARITANADQVKPIHEDLSRMPAVLRFMIVIPDPAQEQSPRGEIHEEKKLEEAPAAKESSNADLEAKLKELG